MMTSLGYEGFLRSYKHMQITAWDLACEAARTHLHEGPTARYIQIRNDLEGLILGAAQEDHRIPPVATIVEELSAEIMRIDGNHPTAKPWTFASTALAAGDRQPADWDVKIK